MNYKGVIIEESLADTSILKDVEILKTEVSPVTEKEQTPWLTKWTLHTVEIPEENVNEFSTRLSKVISSNPNAWYADYKNEKWHYIVFPNKIFQVDLNDPVIYDEAKKHGISLGIPDYQVDFKLEELI